jgi:septal ring factor EnvC (AmiA/AmiB activator)
MAPLYTGNEITGILCFFRDTTRRKENEGKLKEQQRELELVNKELKEQREEIETANEELQENFFLLKAAQEALIENETRLTEAQAVAQLGSWEFDIEIIKFIGQKN